MLTLEMVLGFALKTESIRTVYVKSINILPLCAQCVMYVILALMADYLIAPYISLVIISIPQTV